MNRTEALQMDRGYNFYADLDEDTNLYCVFGTESGFAYSSHASPNQAERAAQEMEGRYGE